MKRLHEMLKYKRPHGSVTEKGWVNRFIMPYHPEVFGDDKDVHAFAVTVRNPNGSLPTVLFSGHTDTVHRAGGKQKLVIQGGFIQKNDGTPLGADDAAGVWIMLEMIDANVPGVYLFHRGEECGGIGSSWMKKNGPEWLSQFKYAVAFDRKATHSVITHQGGSRCCSEDFGNALSDALNEQNEKFMYITDDTGVFTDTKNYIKLIKECTNVSVGYYDEHRPTERLDIAHVVALRNACIGIGENWQELPSVRDEKKDEYKAREPGRWGGYKVSSKSLSPQPSLFDMTDEELEDYLEQGTGIQKMYDATKKSYQRH